MYKAAVRWMMKRNIAALNAGDYGPALAMYAADATLAFPGDNSWSRQLRAPQSGRRSQPTHRGRAEIELFLQRYVEHGIQMEVEDILVNGPPWNMRAAAVVNDWALDAAGNEIYANRAVLVVRAKWGKIQTHEDYEDCERVSRYDRRLEREASSS
jgi:ketosteroid isomerase-like protein